MAAPIEVMFPFRVAPVAVNEEAAWVVTIGTAVATYVRLVGLVSDPLFVGVSVIVPAVVGVIVNVCATAEEKVRTVGLSPKPAVGVIVIVPVYDPFGVTVKFEDALLTFPPVGPVRVKVVTGLTDVVKVWSPP